MKPPPDDTEVIEALRKKFQQPTPQTASDYCLNCLAFTGGDLYCCKICELVHTKETL